MDPFSFSYQASITLSLFACRKRHRKLLVKTTKKSPQKNIFSFLVLFIETVMFGELLTVLTSDNFLFDAFLYIAWRPLKLPSLFFFYKIKNGGFGVFL